MSRRGLFAAILIGAILAPGLATGQSAGQTVGEDLAEFRRLRAEAVNRAGEGDLGAAAEALRLADARVPNHPGLILLRARIAVLADDVGAAAAQLERYARAGLTLDLAGDRHFAPHADDPRLAVAAGLLSGNARPVGAGRLSRLAAPPGLLLIESAAHDPVRERWLASSVHRRTVFQLTPESGLEPFLAADADLAGVLGLALDPARDVLWAATAGVAPAEGLDGARRGTAELVAIDPGSGAIRARFTPPTDGEHAFGDLALGADGTVYVSDSASGEVLGLAPGGSALEVIIPAGQLGSPQGLVVTPDGAALIVADYSSGLHRIDLGDASVTRLAAPEEAALIGIDGLVLLGDRIMAIQNGTAPHRVLALTLDAGFTRIVRVETLAANLDDLDEPTTGLALDGDLVFVSRSQWSDFDVEGAPRANDPAPAVISRLDAQQENAP